MFNKGLDVYQEKGISAAELILESLIASPVEEIKRVLDFGSGYGRVARHLRCLFPKAELSFCDPEGAEFCSNRFNGTTIPPSASFCQLSLPQHYDLIWVGSVFTHLNWEDMSGLFSKLLSSTSNDGVLIASFSGAAALLKAACSDRYRLPNEQWLDICNQYHELGVGWVKTTSGYHPGWGRSLIKIGRILELGKTQDRAKLIMLSEGRWGGLQDIGAWIRN
jgi:hypothetical protein